MPGRASFLVSGRRTYADVVARPFINARNRQQRESGSGQQIDPTAYFYDLNAKLNWRATSRDRFYVSLYGGSDVFGFDATDPEFRCDQNGCAPTGTEARGGGNLDWGNLTGSARYTRLVSPRVFGALTLIASDYGFNVGASAEQGIGGPEAARASAAYRSGIRDVAARLDLDIASGRGHASRVGMAAALHRFTPGALALVGTGPDVAAIDTLIGANRTFGADVTAYAEDEWDVSARLALGLGLHTALYTSGGALVSQSGAAPVGRVPGARPARRQGVVRGHAAAAAPAHVRRRHRPPR